MSSMAVMSQSDVLLYGALGGLFPIAYRIIKVVTDPGTKPLPSWPLVILAAILSASVGAFVAKAKMGTPSNLGFIEFLSY